jgi:hypothetical protein
MVHPYLRRRNKGSGRLSSPAAPHDLDELRDVLKRRWCALRSIAIVAATFPAQADGLGRAMATFSQCRHDAPL